jgi:hypothetical protein
MSEETAGALKKPVFILEIQYVYCLELNMCNDGLFSLLTA